MKGNEIIFTKEQFNDCVKACFHWDSRVDSQASRRTKCCESVITLVNEITNKIIY